MRIIGPPSASLQTVLANIPSIAHGGVFELQMIPALWSAAVSLNIDPVGVIAQSGKETAWGTFPGKVRPQFCNPCGLKNHDLGLFPGYDDGDNPGAHARFANWQVGALAHAQHLRAYAGWPVDGLIVDPRYSFVVGIRLENFEELSGHWAPSLTYGPELVAAARILQHS